jgi:hypothetical protein
MEVKRGGKIPKVLEERLLITPEDRVLLKAIEQMSPRDTGNIYITPTIFQSPVPTLNQIAMKMSGFDESAYDPKKPSSFKHESKKLEVAKQKISSQLKKIADVWHIPDPKYLPTANGLFGEEEALISAVVNQHKLRWDDTLSDYRVPKIHVFSAEMGTGTLFTNNDAFLGEKIVRQSMGLNEMLSSYVIQGGLMPEFIQMFGKAKNQRALLTGLDKSGKNGDNGKEEELRKINQILDLGGFKLSERAHKNLEQNVINTLSSTEEAARSVAHEVAPLFANIPEEIPIHYQWSYNDYANMSETLDTLLPKLRKLHQEMKNATKKLPEWRGKLEGLKSELSENLIKKLIGERVYSHVSTRKEKFGEGEFPERGEDYRKIMDSFFRTRGKTDTKMLKSLHDKVKKRYEEVSGRKIDDKRKEEEFDSLFYDTTRKAHEDLTTFNKLKDFYESSQDRFVANSKKIDSLEDKIHDAERFENSLMAEFSEGPAWFTKKIAISPTEAKAFYMVTKQINEDFYKTLFSEVGKINGKSHKFFLHTDDIINIEIPDPQYSLEGREADPNRPIGTTILSMPRTNAQKSNEPVLNTFSELLSFHESEISEGVKKGKVKPRLKKEHNKRDFAFPDIALTSWGADGYNMQEKMTVDQTTVQGEYSRAPIITAYIKLPTRHDTQKLGTLMVKGNKGTWPAKRIVKGGNTTGPVFYIQHPDQSNESIFVDDDYLKGIGKKYGERYSQLESDLKKFELEGKAKESEKTKAEINSLLDEVRPEIYRVFLQNDMHLGSFSMPGRVSNIDGIRASQLVALQTNGFNNIKYSIMTEALHGELGYRDYDSKRESATNDFLMVSNDVPGFMKRLSILEHRMREKGASDGEILEATQIYAKEFEEGQPKFKPEDQKATFMEVLYAPNAELMENKIPLFIGAGNHWMGSHRGNAEDEANVVASMFDRKYQEQNLLRRGQSASGQGFTYEMIDLPGANGVIKGVATHKMWHGRSEISMISAQATGTREGAVYYFAGDRHHYGAIAERGKMGILDVGKQTTIAYRKMIGKSASVRGAIVGGYGGRGELLLSTRSYLDPVIDIVSGWDYKMGILSRAKSLIEEGIKDDSIYREMKMMNYQLEKNKDKFNRLEKKLNLIVH